MNMDAFKKERSSDSFTSRYVDDAIAVWCSSIAEIPKIEVFMLSFEIKGKKFDCFFPRHMVLWYR